MLNTKQVVYATLRRVALDEGLEMQDLSDHSSLVDDLGFRSLHIARVLAVLEMELERDPFASGELPVTDIRTVGDICVAYRHLPGA